MLFWRYSVFHGIRFKLGLLTVLFVRMGRLFSLGLLESRRAVIVSHERDAIGINFIIGIARF